MEAPPSLESWANALRGPGLESLVSPFPMDFNFPAEGILGPKALKKQMQEIKTIINIILFCMVNYYSDIVVSSFNFCFTLQSSRLKVIIRIQCKQNFTEKNIRFILLMNVTSEC